MGNDQHSNQSHQRSSADDPLAQLHQFYQSTQPQKPIRTNSNQTSSQKSPQQGGENVLQKGLKQIQFWWQKGLEHVKPWLEKVRSWPIFDRIVEYHKWILVAVGILFFGLIGWIILADSTPPEELIAKFEKAMIEEDKEELKDLIVSDHSQLEINDVFLTKLIQQGKEDENFLTNTVLLLNAQKDVYEQKTSEVSSQLLSENNITRAQLLNIGSIYLKLEKGMFKDSYQIAVRPYYIKIDMSEEPTTVKIDGKPIKVKKGSKEHLHGPILPGKYQVQVIKKYPFSNVVAEKDVNLFEGDRTESVFMDLRGETVGFDSEVEGTELFINNRPTHQKVGSKSVEFGPISTDGSLKAHGEFSFPWGRVKSNPVTIDRVKFGGYDVTPNPFTNSKVKSDIIQVINDYIQQYIAAKMKKDANIFTTIDEESKQKWTNSFADQKKYKPNMYFKGEVIKTIVATKGVTIAKVSQSDAYKVKVPVQFHTRERTYHYGDTGDEPLEEKIDDTYVWLIYNMKTQKWEITEINNMYFSDGIFTDSQTVTTNFQ